MYEYSILIGWRSHMGWSETTRERYHVAADTPEEAHAIVNAISHYGYRPGHRQSVNDAVLVEEGDRLLRVGEAVRLVYLEVVKD